MAEYAGESLAKKVARVRLYLRVNYLLHAAGRSEDRSVLVLPGPEAAEAGCLKYIMQPTRLYAVDRDFDAVDRLFDRTEDAGCGIEETCGHGGSLDPDKDLFEQQYDFVHLDLMGNLSSHQGRLAAPYMNHLKPGGILAITFLRGREHKKERAEIAYFKALHEIFSMKKKFRRLFGPDYSRAGAHFQDILHEAFLFMVRNNKESVEKVFGKIETEEDMHNAAYQVADDLRQIPVNFNPVASYTYQAEVSPMGVLAIQLIPGKPTSRYEKVLHGKVTSTPRLERRLISGRIHKDPMTDILHEADLLAKEGFVNAEVAEMLNVSTGTLAAWRAHRTMGTYTDAA